MITIEKEDEIRAMVKSGLLFCEIKRLSGTSHKTVARIRRAIEVEKLLEAEKLEEIRNYLLMGLTVRVAAGRALVSSETVKSVRRLYYLSIRRTGKISKKCPTCGSVMFPDAIAETTKVRAIPLIYPTIPGNINQLYKIAAEIVGLNDLHLITNPLFYDLAVRAEETLEKINDEEKARAA